MSAASFTKRAYSGAVSKHSLKRHRSMLQRQASGLPVHSTNGQPRIPRRQYTMSVLPAVTHALWMAFAMFWEILWPLILGFVFSGLVQAVVSKAEMSKLLPNDSPKSLATATGLGAASSSCSYAAVALARSIFRSTSTFMQ